MNEIKKKVNIEIGEQEAKEFELFCLAKMISGEQSFEYLKHEKIRDGRLIIHLKLTKHTDLL